MEKKPNKLKNIIHNIIFAIACLNIIATLLIVIFIQDSFSPLELSKFTIISSALMFFSAGYFYWRVNYYMKNKCKKQE